MMLDTLIVMGMASVSLGTIHEQDGVQEHTFLLRWCGKDATTLRNGYTSCGCTTIHFDKGRQLQPGDSTAVTLRFNPRHKGGDFEEMGTLLYGDRPNKLQLTLTGTCITSEETLLQQFPIRINDHLRLSTDRMDLGRMQVGETRERGLVVLHRDEEDRRERIIIRYSPTSATRKGLQHIPYPIEVEAGGKRHKVTITLDVFIL